MKRDALDNFEELPESEYAELFVVLMLNSELFVRSSNVYIGDDWMTFGNTVVDWTSVEMKWYLEDQGVSSAEQKDIITHLQADLFRIDMDENILFPFSENEYSLAVPGKRMFAYLSTDADETKIEKALRSRMQETGSSELSVPFFINRRNV